MTGSMSEPSRDWRETVRVFVHPRVVTMLFLGLSAGLPLLLIFSSLSLWLREAGVERSAVTFFSWAALGYSFKFVWAPLVDRLPLPLLTRRLGRRRAWLLLAQCGIIAALAWMALTDPAGGGATLTTMALAAVLLGFSAATQDIVIDAYRIESAEVRLQAMMASTYIAGYRIGMLVSGAGALYLASWLGSDKDSYDYGAWMLTYLTMAAVMGVGVATTLIIEEPSGERAAVHRHGVREYAGFLLMFILAVAVFIAVFASSGDLAGRAGDDLGAALGNDALAGFLVEAARLALALAAAVTAASILTSTALVNREIAVETYVEPVREFFTRHGVGLALLLLALIGMYRISDIVLGVISNVFYQDLDFTKEEIATVVKTFGLFMTIGGGFLGGLLSVRYGVMRIMFLGAVLAMATNLLFVALAMAGNSLPMLYVVISADNLAAGLASAAFVAFLSSLTNIRFTAMQYAIFSSLMTLVPKVMGGYSGTMVDAVGYVNFFIITAVLGLPVLALVWLAGRHLVVDAAADAEAAPSRP